MTDPALAAVLEMSETVERDQAAMREELDALRKDFAELLRRNSSLAAEVQSLRDNPVEVKNVFIDPLNPNARGEKGEPGLTGSEGRGIADTRIVNGDLILRFTDGATQNVGRVVGENGKAGDPGPIGPAGPAGGNGKDSTIPGPKGDSGRGIESVKVVDGVLAVTLSDGALVRAGEVMGPVGQKGADGVNGIDGRDGRDAPPATPGAKGDPGRDGKDGISREEFEKAVRTAREEGVAEALGMIAFDGRSLSIGERSFRLPIMEFKGYWKEGVPFEKGDVVQYGGQIWHCNADAPDHGPASGSGWTLMVKRGRDGKEPVKLETAAKVSAR